MNTYQQHALGCTEYISTSCLGLHLSRTCALALEDSKDPHASFTLSEQSVPHIIYGPEYRHVVAHVAFTVVSGPSLTYMQVT